MRKAWFWIGAVTVVVLLSACSTTTEEMQVPPPQSYDGPVVEISGVEPRYEPYNQSTLQDYEINGDTYRIVQDPQNFSQIGLASWRGEEANGKTTAIGEPFEPHAMSAAHPTLPIPSYVRVTNQANGRQLVVRVNDRGPYTPGRIIDLSTAAADRLNLSNSTKVRVDFISVASDGSLSGPGSIGTAVAKQSYALPARPELGTSSPGAPILIEAAGTHDVDVSPVDNSNLNIDADNAPTHRSGGFLRAPTPLPSGILEDSEPLAVVAPETTATNVTASNIAGRFVVQVGALSDAVRAQNWQRQLSQQFGVPGKISANGSLHRVQLGPFSNHLQAMQIQQRLINEAQQQSFIVAMP